MSAAGDHYEERAALLAARFGVEVERYRNSSSGSAKIGTKTIQTPRPRGPVSFAIFAHEVGHHVLGHTRPDVGRFPRWVEETEAWDFAIDVMERFEMTEAAILRAIKEATNSLEYAYAKAMRRGVKAETIAERYPAWWARCLHGLRLRAISAASFSHPEPQK